MTDFTIGAEDDAPAITYDLVGAADLSTASVSFHMVTYWDEDVVVDGDAVVVNADENRVTYTWNDDDTSEVGYYKAEFEVTYDDGSVETFPNDEWLLVAVTPTAA